jgi:Raf kinase inhibitor-like YbhB/YbcL family protein
MKTPRRWILPLSVVAALAWSGAADTQEASLKITSSAFDEGQPIPRKYTCEGEDASPPLTWEGVPEKTNSLALINDDPDAPGRTWVHWVLFNLPPETTALLEKVLPKKTLDNGARQGINDFRNIGYGGPCPPRGTHRYFFKLYALDILLDLNPGATKADVENAMKGHIRAKAQLMGTYARRN